MVKKLLLKLVLIISIFSCTKTDKIQLAETLNLNVQSKNIKTFEIVTLTINENILGSYKGKIGNQEIELFKSSDSTLVFYVPDLKEGENYLTFDLGVVKFNVLKTAVPDKKMFVDNISSMFDQRMDEVNKMGQSDTVDIFSGNLLKTNTLKLFNSLSAVQQKETMLFYEANKDQFNQFSETIFREINAVTVINSGQTGNFPNLLSQQSDCPRNEGWNAFYGCTAENLAVSATELGKVSVEFFKMAGMAGLMAGTALKLSALGPAALGITAVGISLPMGTAIYMLMLDIYPAAKKFGRALIPFLEAIWVPTNSLFSNVNLVFSSEISTSLNLLPSYRTIGENDLDVNIGSKKLISALKAIKSHWNQLSDLIGDFPGFRNSEKKVTLKTSEIGISNISNSNVTYLGNDGQQLKFKSTSGKDEEFTFSIRVSKEGFIQQKTVNGKVLSGAGQYRIQIGDHNPDYSKMSVMETLNPGDQFFTPNFIERMVRLTKDGIPVKVGGNGLDWTGIVFGSYPVSSTDIKLQSYEVSIYDFTNNKNVKIPLNVTLSNMAYSMLVDKTYTLNTYYDGNLRSSGKITFSINGEFVVFDSNGKVIFKSQYSFAPAISPSYFICPTFENYEVLGTLYLPGMSPYYYFNLTKNGILRPSVHYACIDKGDYVEIK
jgi:hypothetical protein